MPLWIAAPPVMTMGEAAIKSFEESGFRRRSMLSQGSTRDTGEILPHKFDTLPANIHTFLSTHPLSYNLPPLMAATRSIY
ncbi:hypothetical protein BBD40_16340 [Paenibacillus ihbetae]|uniref:Uncharacterized protein n=1 Tax=Paenibacillus ihbetae TaxID=1870820 RepID=A0ABX3K1I5_9BACL|nr:hypothetical protein BBD40_16340 [Paenibacillus ihbetae]